MFRVERLRVEAQLKSGRENLVGGLSFSIECGQRLAIVGESGCGKTMTAMAIMGLLPENCRAQGKILLAGTDLLELTDRERERIRGRKLVLIPQSGAEFLNPVLTVRAQIFETLRRLKLRRRSAGNAGKGTAFPGGI